MLVKDLLANPYLDPGYPLEGWQPNLPPRRPDPDLGAPFATVVAQGRIPYPLPGYRTLRRSTVVTGPVVVKLEEWLVTALGWLPRTKAVIIPPQTGRKR